jgi:hypothetical protein
MRQQKARSHSKSVADPKTFAAEHRKRVGHRVRTAISAAALEPKLSFEPKLNEDARAIENRVQAFSTEELLTRYHELVDKRFEGQLPYTEYFEIERIEALLDAEDQGEISRMTALQHDWRRERSQLVASIERLLSSF